MATTISKRQQARNERQLQDLVQTVAGNDRCADCSARNPSWASWNLGIFLCIRCATLHRKLGTHVSKVKSLSMDSWNTDQVDNMKRTGNAKSNAIHNPKGARAHLPVDADEIDGVMEKFIRQKYEQKKLSGTDAPTTRQGTGSTSTESWHEETPALPPKPSKKFGFISAPFHRSKQQPAYTPPLSAYTPPLSPANNINGDSDLFDEGARSKKLNKPSQMFGMKITGSGNNFNSQLAMLANMGFEDNRKNNEVLKSTNGNIDEAVEALVNSGNGGGRGQASGSRAHTPISAPSEGAGITVEKTRPRESEGVADPSRITLQIPQRATTQPLPRAQSAGPVSTSWNPFLGPTTQTSPNIQAQGLESRLQNLQMSQTGPAAQQHAPQQPYYTGPYQSPSLASHLAWNSSQPQVQTPPAFSADTTSGAQQHFSQTELTNQNNPFLRSSRSQNFSANNPWSLSQAHQQSYATLPKPSLNPWATVQQPPSQPFVEICRPAQSPVRQDWSGQAMHSLPPIYDQSASLLSQPPAHHYPPNQTQHYLQQPAPQAGQNFSQGLEPQCHGVTPQMQHPQVPLRPDKSSILALYNMPQLAPQRPVHGGSGVMLNDSQAAAPQSSSAMPVSGSLNPFGAPASQTASAPPSAIGQASRASVDFQGLGGRQSPDAFAALSSKYMR